MFEHLQDTWHVLFPQDKLPTLSSLQAGAAKVLHLEEEAASHQFPMSSGSHNIRYSWPLLVQDGVKILDEKYVRGLSSPGRAPSSNRRCTLRQKPHKACTLLYCQLTAVPIAMVQII